MISFGSCIYPTLGSVKVSPSRVASPENYQHQTLKVSGVTLNYLTRGAGGILGHLRSFALVLEMYATPGDR